MNNLTTKEIACVFHLYASSKVFFNDRIGIVVSHYTVAGTHKKEHPVWCVSLEEDDEQSELSCSVSIEKVQILLRPLSDISDEERDVCYHLYCAHISYDYTMDFKSHTQSAKHWIEQDGEKYLYATPQQSDYLRQQGIAVPLFIAPGHPDNGKDAIALGLAIDATLQS